MKKILTLSLATISSLLAFGCNQNNNESQKPSIGEPSMFNEYYIHYYGRHVIESDEVSLNFSGSGFEIKVNCTDDENSVSATFKSTITNYSTHYISVFVDGEFNEKLGLTSGTNTIKLVSGLSKGNHYIKIVKANEVNYAKMSLTDLSLTGLEMLQFDKDLKKRIEVCGDSITSGYGVLGTRAEGFSLETEDAAYTYGYLAAQELGYDYSIVSQSGISLSMNAFGSSYFYKDLYPTIDGTTIFDRSTYSIDYAIINLGTNDNTKFKQLPSTEQNSMAGKFHDDYLALVTSIQEINPNCKFIFCYNMMVQMDGLLYTAIEGVCNKLNEESLYDCAYMLGFQIDYAGCDGHPGKEAHAKNAKILADKIVEIESEL